MSNSEKRKESRQALWFKIVLFILPKIVGSYFQLVDLTSKKVVYNQGIEEKVCKKRSFCLAGFHGALLWAAYYFRKYRGVIMVSRSSDGEIIDRVLRHWGYDTTRGSSSTYGKEALQEMIDLVNQTGCNSGMAVDAPRGPARIAKVGAIIVSRETGQPIVPIGTSTTRHIQFNSWDKMTLPLPFGKVVTVLGEPIQVPSGLSREEYETLRRQLEERIEACQATAEQTVRDLIRVAGPIVAKPAA